jgi:CRP-like cAMP-binding protein
MESNSDFLKYVPIFSTLDQSIIDQISKLGTTKSAVKGSVLVFEKETSSNFFIIISGKVKVSRIGNDGKEIILVLLSESDFFGEMSIIDGQSRSANVAAIEDSELFIIQRGEFLDLLHSHPEIAVALLQEFCARLRAADIKIKSLSLMDADGRVASVIIQLADDIGKIKHGTVEIEKMPFQHDLANMAGTSRETISRTLHAFENKGLVELDGSTLRIPNYEKFKESFS